MIVISISTSKFAKHHKVDVTLPAKGLVLVTGKNGHGKSTLPEAVAQCIWNKPIRGKPGWRMEETSGVRVDFEGGYVRRLVGKAKHQLEWLVGDAGAGEWPTRTKSQTELETHVGTFHVWRHACVFHTKDASVFTEATDAERKRLLEDVLELSRVEKAYRDGMKEVSVAKTELTAATHALQMARAKLTGLTDQKALLTGEYEDVPDLDAMREDGRELKRLLDEQKQHYEEWQTALRSARESYSRLDVEFEQAKARRSRFQNMEGTCSECEQDLPDAHLAKQTADAQAAVYEIEVRHTKAYHEVQHWKEEVERARLELEDYRSKYDDNVSRGREAVATKKRNDDRRAKEQTIDAEITVAEEAVTEAEGVETKAAKSLAELEAAAQVLSYKGARAGMLAGSVESLETLANAWLQKLGLQHLQVKLGSQSENKKKVITDKISFEVIGAGGGYGYQAASTGEQRRIDIAMLLAIGELAGDSRGLSPESTMFVDELFDGLDHEGVAAVVSMLRELSRERCVVVITHSDRLVTSLAPDLHLVAQDGSISGK